MEFNVDGNIKGLKAALFEIVDCLSFGSRAWGHRNYIQNLYTSISSFFIGNYNFTYMKNEETKRIVHEDIDTLFNVIDVMYDYGDSSNVLREKIMIFKNKLDIFEKNIKSL